MARTQSQRSKSDLAAKAHDHKEQEAVPRPDIGIQAQFKMKLPPATWRHDRPLDPSFGSGTTAYRAVTMETTHKRGDDVPAWFWDADYNELAFCVGQAYFPRTAARDNLKRGLRGVYADSVWEHLAGTTSALFAAGEPRQNAVKVIDDRGNDLLVARKLSEAEEGKC